MSWLTWIGLAAVCFTWFGGGLCLGLWIGERGRRKDAQRREGAIQVDEPERATVIPPGPPTPGSAKRELAEPPPSFVSEMRAEGFTDEEIREEWGTMLTKAYSDNVAGPPA